MKMDQVQELPGCLDHIIQSGYGLQYSGPG